MSRWLSTGWFFLSTWLPVCSNSWFSPHPPRPPPKPSECVSSSYRHKESGAASSAREFVHVPAKSSLRHLYPRDAFVLFVEESLSFLSLSFSFTFLSFSTFLSFRGRWDVGHKTDEKYILKKIPRRSTVI